MSIWNELKSEILQEYPPIKSLPILKRIRVMLFADESQIAFTKYNENTEYTQHAILVNVDGVEYTKRFGWLK